MVEFPYEHFSRGWGDDPFAPACGCEVAPCGKVVLAGVRQGCDQHDFLTAARTIRSGHSAERCPAPPEEAKSDG